MKTMQYILFIILLVFLSCETGTNPGNNISDQKGMINISSDMTLVPSEVTGLKGKLYNNNGEEIIFDFENSENSATALVENIPSGHWNLQIDAFNEDGKILNSGTSKITIYSGDVISLSIHLNPTTKNIKIRDMD